MTLPELFAAIHATVAANWPGRLPVHVTIELLDGKPISLPVPPPAVSAPPVAPKPPEDGEERHGHALSPCVLDILAVLTAAGRPLATTALLAELARAGKEWSERTVAGHLAELVKDGTLENPKNVKPAGYRLPEWAWGRQEPPEGAAPVANAARQQKEHADGLFAAVAAAPPVAPAPIEEATDERGRGVPACVTDILETLREVGHPLTKFRLLFEMEKRNRLWGESTVMRHMKALMESGDVENPEGARPRGYRLPDADTKGNGAGPVA